MQRLELTLAILKPHIISHPYALDSIKNLILTSNFKIVRSKTHKLSQEEAFEFYKEHADKFFFKRLTGLMTSGPSFMCILAKANAIADWRKLMGPTKVFKSQFEAPDSIRGRFGLSDTRNATHGSDSPDSVIRDLKIVFPDFDYKLWLTKEEQYFRKGLIDFCKEDFVHKIKVSNLAEAGFMM